MIIPGPHPSPRPLGPGAPAGRADAAPTPFAAPATAADAPSEAVPDPAEPGGTTGSGSAAHPTGSGLAGAAGVSHRSDVAALRQWINHPGLRNDLPLPDLTVDHHGNGFQKAVAAYQAAIATVDPAPVTAPVADPAPVTDSGPVTDPAPITGTPTGDPAVITDEAPTTDAAAVTDPVLTGPIADPLASDPAVLGTPLGIGEQPTVVTDPAPAAVDSRTAVDATPVVEAGPPVDPAPLPDTGSTAAT